MLDTSINTDVLNARQPSKYTTVALTYLRQVVRSLSESPFISNLLVFVCSTVCCTVQVLTRVGFMLTSPVKVVCFPVLRVLQEIFINLNSL